MPLSFREQRLNQLTQRRRKPVQGYHSLTAYMQSIREKGLFWLFTVAALFFTALLMAGMAYLLMDRSGLLNPPLVFRLDDARWGTQYQVPGKPLTSVMTQGSQVYIGTAGHGLHVYEKDAQVWRSYNRSDQSGSLPYDWVRWLKQDEADPSRIWVLTARGGLSSTANARIPRWRTLFGATPFPGLGETLTTAARNGSFIAVGTKRHGLGVYDLAHRSWLDLDDRVGGNRQVYAVRAGQDPGVFWAGTSDGVWRLEGNRIVQQYRPDSISTAAIDLEVGSDGVWYLGDRGRTVGHIDRTNRQHILATAGTIPFNPLEMTDAAQHDQTLWIGTDRDGVHTYDLGTRQWQSLSLPGPDSTTMRHVTALTYNPAAGEMLISGDTGLHIIPQTASSETTRPDTLHFAEYPAIQSFQARDMDTYFLTQDGQIGIRRGNKSGEAGAWWKNILTNTQADSSDLVTLVDVSAVRIDPDDISAACQSDEYLYFGTIHGDIVWYHKPTHAWTTLKVPLPFGVDDLIFNPYTKSVVALSGRALYRSPPSLDIFILYYSTGAEAVKVVPIRNGYLLYTGDRTITIFDETTNRREAIFLRNEAPEPDFKPVAVEKIGAQVYFVTATGGVMIYDTLRHQWLRPPDIPHKDVVDLRGTGYRSIYQTSKQALYVPGSFPILGGGDAGLEDQDIRHAAVNTSHIWIAGDRFISRYDQQSHTWDNARRIELGEAGTPAHMLPLEGRLVYRTGPRSGTGDLWMDGRRIDRQVDEVVSTRNILWYTRPQGLYSWQVRAGSPARAVSYEGVDRLPGEQLTAAADTPNTLWLGTNRRLLGYDLRQRQWQRLSLPGNGIDQLFTAKQSLYASTGDALYELPEGNTLWRRLSVPGQRVLDLAASPNGFVLLYENGILDQITPSNGDQSAGNIRITPNDAPVPITLSNVLAAAQYDDDLCLVSDGYLHRYHTRSHRWASPVPIADRSVRRAAFLDNRLITLLENGQVFFTDMLDPSPTLWIEPDEAALSALNNTADMVWIDTPLWQWARREGRPDIVMKAQQGSDQSLEALTGNRLTRFPFDRIQAVAHDGVDVWLSTDMGLMRFPQTSHGHIDAWSWFRQEALDRIDYIRLEDQAYALIGWPNQDAETTWLFDRDSQSWRRTSNNELGLDPQHEAIMIDTPLWRWTKTDQTIRAAFVDTDLRDISVFSDEARRWQFRFDRVRGIAQLGQDLLGITDGLLCRYTVRDSTLALSSMALSPGPAIPDRAQVRIAQGSDGHYLSIQLPGGNRAIYRLTSDNKVAFEAYRGQTDPFEQTMLADTPVWQWTRSENTGRIEKYLKRDGTLHQVNMINGRFSFDALRNFAVSGDNVWLATANGIARYPFSRSSLSIEELQYETTIAGIDEPDVVRINIKGNTLYCEIAGHGLFSRRLTDQSWKPATLDEDPWVRRPISTPFWFWDHDVKQGTVSGRYRDVTQQEHPVTWPEGVFTFDRTTDLAWYQDAVWLATGAGIISYPRYEGFFDMDSLKVYPDHPQSDGLITVAEDRMAVPGLYTRYQNRLSRLNSNTNTWDIVPPDTAPDETYTALSYLNDRYEYRILADYDGFWRCRRRETGDPSRLPNVILEAQVNGRWAKVAMTAGRFDFDVVTDFVLDETDLWLATQAGLCRYDLKANWLDLRHMRPLWGDQYTNTTDIRIARRDAEEQIFFRRGKNRDAIFAFNPEDQAARRVSAIDSPFMNAPLVETPYWRWSRQERYQGSVAIGRSLRLDLKSAAGVWAEVPFTSARMPFPFDTAADLILYQDAVWLATPSGIWQYPTDKPFTLEHATLHWDNGQLEQASKLMLNPDGRLYGTIGTGRFNQTFYLDSRDRWQPAGDRQAPAQFRFREDQWFWYEGEQQVEIRYENDPSRLRLIHERQFADHYIQAVTSDKDALWSLTPAGLIRYTGRAEQDTLRIARWYTGTDFQGTPAHLQHLLPASGGLSRKTFTILRHRDDLWLLTQDGFLRYKVVPATYDLVFNAALDLPEILPPVIDGHLFFDTNGPLRMTLLTFEKATPRQTTYLIDPQTGQMTQPPPYRLTASSQQAGYTLPDEQAVITTSEDADYLWMATPDAVYRVEKAALEYGEWRMENGK